MSKYTISAAETFRSEHGHDASFIPQGVYCYSDLSITYDEKGMPVFRSKVCPYWAIDKDREEQSNGYCAFIGAGDWFDCSGSSLLWDQVKECGIKTDFDDEIDIEKAEVA